MFSLRIFLKCQLALILIFALFGLAQPSEAEQEIRGAVEEIAEDGSYIVVEGAKIITLAEVVKSSLLAVGDNVILQVTKKGNDIELVSLKYAFQEVLSETYYEEQMTKTEEEAKDESQESSKVKKGSVLISQ
ncbi:MAG: hypothetical protein JW869_01375 [Candidatus Omnitrophica bacterium]|nr:hypothetical protein [Candidatus Omnitrophota bacterium]